MTSTGLEAGLEIGIALGVLVGFELEIGNVLWLGLKLGSGLGLINLKTHGMEIHRIMDDVFIVSGDCICHRQSEKLCPYVCLSE